MELNKEKNKTTISVNLKRRQGTDNNRETALYLQVIYRRKRAIIFSQIINIQHMNTHAFLSASNLYPILIEPHRDIRKKSRCSYRLPFYPSPPSPRRSPSYTGLLQNSQK